MSRQSFILGENTHKLQPFGGDAGLEPQEQEVNFGEKAVIADIEKFVPILEKEIEKISQDILTGKLGILDSAIEMGKLTRHALTHLAEQVSKIMQLEVSKLPFAIFLFGSTARNLMLPNSDLDAMLVFEKNCPEQIKALVKKIITTLPFNDVEDIEQKDSIESLDRRNCPSIMQWNKIVEASYATGSDSIACQHKELVETQDSRKDREERFIIQYWFWHKADYRMRSSEHGMNIKYDFGASRDVVLLDWYYLLDENNQRSLEKPTTLSSLDYLENSGKISKEEHLQLIKSLEMIFLVKFALWEKHKQTGDGRLLHLSDFSLDACFKEIGDLLQKQNINNVDELTFAYNQAKGKIHQLVTELFEDVAAKNPKSMRLWEMAKDKNNLDQEVLEILKNSTWYELVPFAIRSTSPEILQYMVKTYSDSEGYEYILRLVSQNKYITDDIIDDLLSSRLDSRIKSNLRPQLSH